MSRPSDSPSPSRFAREGDPLTDREVHILSLVAGGEPTSAISRRAGIAETTVKSHLTHVYRKLGCRNRVQAARHYLDHYGSEPLTEADRSGEGGGDTALIDRQMREIQTRLDHLDHATPEAERLRRALDALRAIEGPRPSRSGSAPDVHERLRQP